MNCCLKNCFNESFTSDGFCEKHKFYTSKDYEHITNHLKKYVHNFNTLTSESDKIKSLLRMFTYLKYKKEFLKFYPKFYNVVLNKSNELIREIEKKGSYNDSIQFKSLVEKVTDLEK